MAYLAVDKDGIESIFRRKPKRIKRTNKWNDAVEKFVCEGRLHPGIDGYEYQKTYGSLQTIKQTTKSILPRGSIKKLIGKSLTWADGPYKLEK